MQFRSPMCWTYGVVLDIRATLTWWGRTGHSIHHTSDRGRPNASLSRELVRERQSKRTQMTIDRLDFLQLSALRNQIWYLFVFIPTTSYHLHLLKSPSVCHLLVLLATGVDQSIGSHYLKSDLKSQTCQFESLALKHWQTSMPTGAESWVKSGNCLQFTLFWKAFISCPYWCNCSKSIHLLLSYPVCTQRCWSLSQCT